VIAKYNVAKSLEEFCCEDDACNYYIKKGEPYVSLVEMNDDGDVITYKKCLSCAIKDIEYDIEERSVFLHRIENI
jgi:hypothetical protein